MLLNPAIDQYLIEGCMRCPLGGTDACKVLNWTEELEVLRKIILDCGLKEEHKWGVACYTFNGRNVLIMSAFKAYCSISFFKGSLLKDPEKLLVKPGPNSQAARLFKFTQKEEIPPLKASIEAYIQEAIEVEKAGLEVQFKKNPEPIPEELVEIFEADPQLKSAFEALTPGRQRGYILHFSQPKRSETRTSRIEKCIPKILNGEGMHDKYQSKRKRK